MCALMSSNRLLAFKGSVKRLNNYVAAKATYIRLLYGQKWGFSALAP